MKIAILIILLLILLPAHTITAQIEPGTTFYADPIWSPAGDQIIFTSNRDGKTDIWSIRPDGTNLLNLTAAIPDEHWLPVWSPDGTRIAFLSGSNNDFDVWAMNSDGQEARRISPPDTNAVIEYVSWSADGKQIAFSTYATTPWPVYTLWIASLSGEQPRFLTEGSAPIWSPDSMWIAFFKRDENQDLDIGLLRPDGSDYQLFDVNVMPFSATIRWSPDSRQLAYNTSTEPLYNNPRDLWIIDISSMQPRQYTSGMGVGGLRWSPDSSMIVFRNEVALDAGELWIIQRDGSGLRVLVSDNEARLGVFTPEWSPNGQFLVFTDSSLDVLETLETLVFSQEGDDFPDLTKNNVWLVNLDGSNQVNLTGNIHDSAGYPKWSPDGSQIVFTTGNLYLIPTSFTDAIWIMNADGSNQRMLIGNESE